MKNSKLYLTYKNKQVLLALTLMFQKEELFCILNLWLTSKDYSFQSIIRYLHQIEKYLVQ